MKHGKLIIKIIICSFAFFFLSCLAEEFSVNTAVHGNEDLSYLLLEELNTLIDDIEKEKNLNHSITEKNEQEIVLNAVKAVTEDQFKKRGLSISWAWYDYEYTYTKEWGLYTLNTHIDYKDEQEVQQKKEVYSEIISKPEGLVVCFLKIGDEITLDNQEIIDEPLWTSATEGIINDASGINLVSYSISDLEELKKKTKAEIELNHTPDPKVSSLVKLLTQAETEQYFVGRGIAISSWAWYDDEYIYTREWDFYTFKTHIDYQDEEGKDHHKESVYSEVFKESNRYEIVYLMIGNNILIDRREDAKVQLSEYLTEPMYLSPSLKKEIEEKKPTDESEFYYTVIDDYVAINGYKGNDPNVIIPQRIEELPVRKINKFQTDKVKNVVIPEGVTELSASAFYKCSNLEQVVLPSTLKTIAKECFYSCINLKNVIGIENIEHFEVSCFSHCQSLTGEFFFRGDTIIESYAFNFTKITGIKLFGRNNVIGIGAFGYSDLKYFYIDKMCNVEFIGLQSVAAGKYIKSSFEDCLNLRELIIPDSVTSFPNTLFYDKNVVTIYTPKGSYAEQEYYKNYEEKSHIKINTDDYEEKVKQYTD